MVDYDPFDPVHVADPYPAFARLRDESPVYQVPGRGYWVLSRFDDVHMALRDHETFSSAKGVGPEPIWAPALITTDPPVHTRLRRLVTKPFTPRAIEATWTERVTELAAAFVEPLVGAGVVDAVESLTWPIPVQVIAEMLGIPTSDLDAFKHWSDELCNGIGGHLDPNMMERTAAAYVEVYAYLEEVIAARRGTGDDRDDLISRLLGGGDGDESLDDREIAHFCILLLIAGNETTTNLLGGMLLTLAANPAVWSALCADPSLAPAAVEEMLRFWSPTQALFRQTTADVTLHGTTIPADSRVMLAIASANRDGRRFDAPDEVRLDRDPNDHLAFGNGIHLCLGAPLARLEARAVLEVLIASTSEITVAGDVRMADNFMLRGPVKLPLVLAPRTSG